MKHVLDFDIARGEVGVGLSRPSPTSHCLEELSQFLVTSPVGSTCGTGLDIQWSTAHMRWLITAGALTRAEGGSYSFTSFARGGGRALTPVARPSADPRGNPWMHCLLW